jgi:hypothetical protein
MTTTANDQITTTETPTPCPSWCLGDHLNDEIPDFEFSGTIHQRKVTVGDTTVTIEETTDAEDGCADPVGPVITDLAAVSFG